MNLSLKEGQAFTDSLTLLEPLAETEHTLIWFALDAERNERIDLKIFKKPLGETARKTLRESLKVQKGLVHPNIVRIYQAGTIEEADEETDEVTAEVTDYVTSQHVNAVSAFDITSDLVQQWPLLQKIFEALEYAHSLGLIHGHLHPKNILITDQNEPMIMDFGLTPCHPPSEEQLHYLSPQIRHNDSQDQSHSLDQNHSLHQSHSMDVVDDIYAMGQMLYFLVTKRFWLESEPSFKSDSPVPAPVADIITQMLNASPYDRPASLSTVQSVLSEALNPQAIENPIISNPHSFTANTPVEPVSQHTTPLPLGLERKERQTIAASTALKLLAALVVISIIVIYLLPTIDVDQPARNEAPVASNQPLSKEHRQANDQQEQTMAPYEVTQIERAKAEGKDLADDLIRLQIKLEGKGVQVWAPSAYKETVSLAEQGDDLYRDGEYVAALNKYKASREQLHELEASIESVLANYQANGDKSLNEGNHQAALEAFTIVTAILHKDATAKKNLLRAENLSKVVELTRESELLASKGKYSQALEGFRQASALDPLWIPAKKGIEQVNREIARQKFADAMSSGFLALEKKQFETARKAFRRAQQILPANTGPRDALIQVEVAGQSANIEQLRSLAQDSETKEQWSAALEYYNQLIALDPSLSFAHQGKDKALERADIDKSLRKYINHPERMKEDKELSAARKAIYKASKLKIQGPQLKSQLSLLSNLISQARIPVRFQLRSDSKTNVVVYKVGELGRFSDKELSLIPGSYTIVGKRAGYQDVQKKVLLMAGRKLEPLVVSCTEKI